VCRYGVPGEDRDRSPLHAAAHGEDGKPEESRLDEAGSHRGPASTTSRYTARTRPHAVRADPGHGVRPRLPAAPLSMVVAVTVAAVVAVSPPASVPWPEGRSSSPPVGNGQEPVARWTPSAWRIGGPARSARSAY
jgi:hypothetical protein